jgi:hypothetical protein
MDISGDHPRYRHHFARLWPRGDRRSLPRCESCAPELRRAKDVFRYYYAGAISLERGRWFKEASMWVIVAVSLGLSGDAPKLKIIPGPEYQTEAECTKAAHFHASFDSQGGGVEFSVCMPKDQVQIGRADEQADKSDK